jgi:hypothetical protein
MEKREGVARLRNFFLGELAVQENIKLSSWAHSGKERDNNRGMNLERKRHETVEALRTFMYSRVRNRLQFTTLNDFILDPHFMRH